MKFAQSILRNLIFQVNKIGAAEQFPAAPILLTYFSEDSELTSSAVLLRYEAVWLKVSVLLE